MLFHVRNHIKATRITIKHRTTCTVPACFFHSHHTTPTHRFVGPQRCASLGPPRLGSPWRRSLRLDRSPRVERSEALAARGGRAEDQGEARQARGDVPLLQTGEGEERESESCSNISDVDVLENESRVVLDSSSLSPASQLSCIGHPSVHELAVSSVTHRTGLHEPTGTGPPNPSPANVRGRRP